MIRNIFAFVNIRISFDVKYHSVQILLKNKLFSSLFDFVRMFVFTVKCASNTASKEYDAINLNDIHFNIRSN